MLVINFGACSTSLFGSRERAVFDRVGDLDFFLAAIMKKNLLYEAGALP